MGKLFKRLVGAPVLAGGPAGGTFTLFGQPASFAALTSDPTGYTMGVQAVSSVPAHVRGIWWWSPPGAAVLPVHINVYDVNSQTVLHSEVASWSGAAGSGWVLASFASPVAVAAGQLFKAAIFQSAASNFYGAVAHYWDTGAGAGGISSGPLSAPNNAAAAQGQDSFFTGGEAYPATSFNATNYGVDLVLGVP